MMKIKEYFQSLVKAGPIPQEPMNYDAATLKIYIDYLEAENAAMHKRLQKCWNKDSVVISRDEFEQHANEYKNLSIKYDQVFDKYRLCKDANETLKQKIISARKETAAEILQKLYRRTRNYHGNRCLLTSKDVIDIAELYGIKLEDEE